MDMSVNHVGPQLALPGQKRIVVQSDTPDTICDLQQIVNTDKILLRLHLVHSGIVIVANNEMLSARQSLQNEFRVAAAVKQITQNIDGVIAGNPLVPGSDDCFIHGIDAVEGMAAHLQNILMDEVSICNKKDHVVFLFSIFQQNKEVKEKMGNRGGDILCAQPTGKKQKKDMASTGFRETPFFTGFDEGDLGARVEIGGIAELAEEEKYVTSQMTFWDRKSATLMENLDLNRVFP